MKRVYLTNGGYALVNDKDFHRVNAFCWRSKRYHKMLYAIRREGKKTIYMHRFILGVLPGVMVDHRNNNGLDNQRSNLRFCNSRLNQANTTLTLRGKSSFRGVKAHKQTKKWRACIGKKSEHIGYYDTEEEAAKAYDKEARRRYGQFAKLNFP